VAQTDGVQVLERVADAEQGAAARYLAASTDNLIQTIHIVIIEAHRQTQLVHAARCALGFEHFERGAGTDQRVKFSYHPASVDHL